MAVNFSGSSGGGGPAEWKTNPSEYTIGGVLSGERGVQEYFTRILAVSLCSFFDHISRGKEIDLARRGDAKHVALEGGPESHVTFENVTSFSHLSVECSVEDDIDLSSIRPTRQTRSWAGFSPPLWTPCSGQ